jgi:periplasmic divalent cation tolerance protein
VYRWQGKVEEAREWSCQMKTTPDRTARLLERVRAFHPYQVPEILVLPVAGGDPSYLRWLAQSVRDS